MNAFLAVKVVRLPANSLDDISTNEMTALMWRNDMLEQYLTQFQVYQEARGDGRIEYLQGTGDTTHTLHCLIDETTMNCICPLSLESGLKSLVAEEGKVMFEYTESVQMFANEFPCQIERVNIEYQIIH